MIYANTVIKDALYLIDVAAIGEDIEAEWFHIGQRILNGLLGEWSASGVYNPNLVSASYTASGVNSITVGTSDDGLTVGNIPVNFMQMQAVQVDLGQTTYTLQQIPLTEYYAQSVKNNQTIPMYYAWDYQPEVSTLHFYPSLLGNLTVRIVGRPTIPAVANIQSNIEIDKVYYNAILYNLACKLYPFLKRQGGIDQELIYQAKASVSGLRKRNAAANSPRVQCAYTGATMPGSDYWLSNLNTVNH